MYYITELCEDKDMQLSVKLKNIPNNFLEIISKVKSMRESIQTLVLKPEVL